MPARRLVLFLVAILTMSAPSMSSADESTASRPARLPGHRNLFNGDCTFLFGNSFLEDPKAKYDAQTLHWFIDMLADCGVDTYLNNVNAQVPWYPSKRTPNILSGYRRGDREFFRGHYR